MAFEVEVGNVNSAVTTLSQVATDAVSARDLAIQVATQKIGDLQTEVDYKLGIINEMAAKLDADDVLIGDYQTKLNAAQAQLAQLGSVKVYDRMESNPWSANTAKSVGGSGLGTGGWKAPGVESAELWIVDQVGVPAPNYVDCYFTQHVPTDGKVTRFKLEASYLFPTAADVAMCQCLEFEARQVTDDKKLVILAGQLRFGAGTLMYFDWVQRAWLSTGIAITRPAPGTWVGVGVEGHRDATAVYYDALTLNGVRTPFTKSYALLATDWSPLLWAALQLDDNSAVNGYRVKIKDVRLTVSA